MAIQFGWFGTRSRAAGTPTPDPVSNADILSWVGSSLGLYMPYGVEGAAGWEQYESWVDDILQNALARGGRHLLLPLPALALNEIEDSGQLERSFLHRIRDKYDDESRTWGYYIEEPNRPAEDAVQPANAPPRRRRRRARWSPETVGVARGSLKKRVVTTVMAARATMRTYRDYAAQTDILCGFHYPLAHDTPEWANIEQLQAADSPLVSLKRNTGEGGFWFCVQAYTGQPNFDSRRQPTVHSSGDSRHSFELMWMTHRALVQGARGILFYHHNRSDTELHEAVRRMCERINDCELDEVLAAGNKDRLATPVSGMNGVQWAYRFYRDSYWLLVVDATPETPGERSYTFDCSLENSQRSGAFSRVEEVYGAPGVAIPATTRPGRHKKRFSGSMHRGGVKLYRLFCGPQP